MPIYRGPDLAWLMRPTTAAPTAAELWALVSNARRDATPCTSRAVRTRRLQSPAAAGFASLRRGPHFVPRPSCHLRQPPPLESQLRQPLLAVVELPGLSEGRPCLVLQVR